MPVETDDPITAAKRAEIAEDWRDSASGCRDFLRDILVAHADTLSVESVHQGHEDAGLTERWDEEDAEDDEDEDGTSLADPAATEGARHV